MKWSLNFIDKLRLSDLSVNKNELAFPRGKQDRQIAKEHWWPKGGKNKLNTLVKEVTASP
jgi:hypothetical protein